jgi:hypothetical protein
MPGRQRIQRLSPGPVTLFISTSYNDWLNVDGSAGLSSAGGASSHQPIITCSKRALVCQWVRVSSSSISHHRKLAQQRNLAVGTFQLNDRQMRARAAFSS